MKKFLSELNRPFLWKFTVFTLFFALLSFLATFYVIDHATPPLAIELVVSVFGGFYLSFLLFYIAIAPHKIEGKNGTLPKKTAFFKELTLLFTKAIKLTKRFFTPDRLKILSLFLIAELLFFIIFFSKQNFIFNFSNKVSLFSFGFLIFSILKKLLFDTVFLFLIVKGSLLLPSKIKPKVFSNTLASLYLLLIFTDTVIYYFGFTLFEKSYLHLITPYSIGGFMTTTAKIGLFLIVLLLILLNLFLKKESKATKSLLIKFTLLLFSLSFITFPYHPAPPSMEWHISQEQKVQIEYAFGNSFIHFIKEFLPLPQNYTVTSELPDSTVLQEYSIPFGERNYKPINLKPFKRVVVFTTESLSLDLLPPFNSSLKEDVASHFYSNFTNEIYTNYKTSSSPTLQGLLTSFNSHPNPNLLLEGNYQNSYVKRLKDDGFHTLFLRGASIYYASENIIFEKNGFIETIGRENFIEDSQSYNPNESWGVTDNLLYHELISILKKSKEDDTKLFVNFLGVDTHPPHGGLGADNFPKKYPTPPDFSEYGSAGKLLESIFFHDYDLALFMENLQKENLWDEQTLLIFTADHASPANSVVVSLPDYPKNNLARIPFLALSPQKLPQTDKTILASQLDLAPTILHLLNLPIPKGYWGNSLFSEEKKPFYAGSDKGTIYIETENRNEIIPPEKRANSPLGEIWNSLFTD